MKASVEVKFEKPVSGINARWVSEIVSKTLKFEKTKPCALSILLTDNRSIRKINKQFLKHDYATDVISFWCEASDLSETESGYLGDLVVSYQMARQMAKELKISFKEEFGRYLVHGTLHLLGYDDKVKKKRELMHKRQEFILNKILKEEAS